MNLLIDSQHVVASNHLVQEALDGAQESPCFWLRGLPGWGGSMSLPPARPESAGRREDLAWLFPLALPSVALMAVEA